MEEESLKREAVETAGVLNSEQKSLSKMILDVNEYYNGHQPLKTVITPVYRNKTNPSDFFECTEAALAAAFKAGKSLTDFELVEEEVNPKEELRTLIFGTGDITPLSELLVFIKACEAATGKRIDFLPSAKPSGKTPDKQAMDKAKQKVYNVAGAVTKGDKTTQQLEEAISEAKSTYAKYGKTYNYNPDSRKGKSKAVIESELKMN